MDGVPTIDIGSPTATSLAELDAACAEHGFFLLRGHGLDEVIDTTWAETARFFDADPAVRESVRRTEDRPLGYFDRELTKRKRDTKVTFDFVDPTTPFKDEYNRWPDDLFGFRDAMVTFFEAFTDLAERTLHLVHDTLDLSVGDRDQVRFNSQGSTVRLNHYPVGDPVPEQERAGLAERGETALGYHTDPGVITLLMQDATGGLQTETRDGQWIDVPPEPGTVVVNLADAMQVWTNDRYRAAVHRVVPMTSARRFSIPYFANPNRDAHIGPLPELSAGAGKYRTFAWHELMAARNADNYADLGTPDTQISNFLLTPADPGDGDDQRFLGGQA